MVIMHQEFMHLFKQCFLRKLCWSSAILGMTLGLIQLPSVSQQLSNSDNIYHEKDNLPDDADIFPRMGKLRDMSRSKPTAALRLGVELLLAFQASRLWKSIAVKLIAMANPGSETPIAVVGFMIAELTCCEP